MSSERAANRWIWDAFTFSTTGLLVGVWGPRWLIVVWMFLVSSLAVTRGVQVELADRLITLYKERADHG